MSKKLVKQLAWKFHTQKSEVLIRKGLSKVEQERELITMKEETSKQQKEMEDLIKEIAEEERFDWLLI